MNEFEYPENWPEQQENPVGETERTEEQEVPEVFEASEPMQQPPEPVPPQNFAGAEVHAEPRPSYGEAYSGAPVYWTQYRPEPYRPIEAPRPVQPAKKVKKKRSLSVGAAVALMLCCALIGGLVGVGGVFLGNYLQRENKNPLTAPSGGHTAIYEGDREPNTVENVRVDTGELLTAAEVYAQNVNSTVGITTSITTNYWGYPTTSAASGSGFILTADGYILTNFHVIESSNSITVTMFDGTAYDAALIGYDESNDIAVLKIDAEGLTPVVLGNSDQMNVGDPVVAIGNPLGELTFSLTQGAISAMERDVTMSNGVSMNLMQTDCAINSGNSGGALFNLYGEVVGITNAKYSSNGYGSEASIDNIGFAIPINSVRSIVTSLIENGYIAKPYIGVSVTDVSAEAQTFGLPKGAAIRSIVEGSPAEQAGLKATDIITEANGEAIESRTDLSSLIAACNVGDTLELKVYRQGEYLNITVVIGEQIQEGLEESSQETQGYGFNPWGFGG